MEYPGLVTQVYVDVMLAVNLVMDFFILWTAGRLANLRIKVGRLFLGALVGAGYSLVVFFPESNMLNSLAAKVICSLLMVLLAFYPVKLKVFLRSLVYLYLISFAMGGAVIAASYLADDAPGYLQVFNGVGVLWGSLHYGWLIVGLTVALVIGWGGMAYLRKNRLQQGLLSSLTISLNGHILRMQALLDTGNQLTDPLTKRPVVVVEGDALRSLLPSGLWNALQQEEPAALELAADLGPEWASRLRLIPFSSVGRSNGMMVGIRPDWVEVTARDGSVCSTDVVLGLVNKTLSQENKYQALLPPAIFDQLYGEGTLSS